MPTAIDIRDLVIKYKSIEPVSVRRGLRELGRSRSNVHEAVRGVSFSVERGEIVGIIGENGSGKSTLLRAVAGIFSPDQGKINTFDNKVSLMAIGVGFQKELTGRVNIILSGMLLGFSEAAIRKKMPEIIEFSELGAFIDKPVRTYSSGMYSKLAFAITAILETDIMLIDEVLSVGDARFKKKSFTKMQELISDKNKTVLIVSHSSETIRKICDRVIWIHQGKVLASGKTKDVLDAYDTFVQTSRRADMKAVILNSGLGKRMGDLTDDCHKSMVKLYNGETIFGRQLRILKECGIHDFIITTGPYEDQLRAEAKKIKGINVTYVRNDIYDKTNYIYSMHLAKEQIQGDILLLHGDLVFNKGLVKKILKSNSPSLACVNKKLAQPEKDFKARLEGSLIREVAVDIFDKNCYAFQPFYKLDRAMTKLWMNRIAKLVEQDDVNVYAEKALNQLLRKTKLTALSYAADYVEEIDNPEDLTRVSKGIKEFDIKEVPIYKSRGSISWIKEILFIEKVKKPMLVCDSSWEFLPVQDYLSREGIEPVFFSDFTPNPKYEDVVKGVDLFQKERCDFIISVGGGSTIDTAKCIKLFSSLDSSKLYLNQAYEWNDIKHLSIPTTAGTGSESTRYSVVYYQDEKQSVMHDSILPEYVILDADLIDTVPDYHKKASYLDALTHCIESLWSVNITRKSRALAKKGIAQLLDNFDAYFAGDSQAAEQVLEAANIAGQAINITQTAAAHAFSYKLTSMYGIAHGHAVAICLPHIWRFIVENQEKTKKAKSLRFTLNNLCDLFASENIEDAIDSFVKLVEKLNMSIPDMKTAHDVDVLAKTVNPTRLANSMVPLTEDDIQKIYKQILTIEG